MYGNLTSSQKHDLQSVLNLYTIDERLVSTKYKYTVYDLKRKCLYIKRQRTIKNHLKEEPELTRSYSNLLNKLFKNRLASVLVFKIIADYFIGPKSIETITS